MKFCKNLQKVADISNPEWAPYWTNYKLLKKLIKDLPQPSTTSPAENAQPTATAPTSSSSSSDTTPAVPATSTTTHFNLQKSPAEVAFFKLLHAEFLKATRFFEKAVIEFSIREERVREGKKQQQQLLDDNSRLAQSIFLLYKDLLLLETYAIMTYCSFSKILKKHDKVTGTSTRAPFMTNVVAKANFTQYPTVLAMISRCETMYAQVSAERNTDKLLYEDERLFIHMIARWNAQALLGNPEDAPPPQQQETTQRTKPERSDLAQLRSLVEEQEQSVDGSLVSQTKRSRDDEYTATAAKRTKTE